MYEQRLPIEEWKAKKQAELKETIAAQKSALQEVGGIQRIGKQNITFRIGK